MNAAVLNEPRRRTIVVPGGEITALDFGDPARPVDVVFAHANGFNASTYRTILTPLAESLRILAIDQRGHGSTRLPTDPDRLKSWRLYRDDLLALLATLEGPAPVLAGHSMGGTVSLLAAGKQPGVARGLCLFDPVIMPRTVALYARMPWTSGSVWKKTPLAQGAAKRRAVFDSKASVFDAYKGRGAFKTWPDASLSDYIDGGFVQREDGKVELACAPAWEAANFAAQGHDPWTALGRIKVPIRIYRAEQGSTCRIGPAEPFELRYPNAKVTTVEGSSHFLPMERPNLIREALLAAAKG
jgi:pimeloyl-ACP methyl ester carboxylesterase